MVLVCFSDYHSTPNYIWHSSTLPPRPAPASNWERGATTVCGNPQQTPAFARALASSPAFRIFSKKRLSLFVHCLLFLLTQKSIQCCSQSNKKLGKIAKIGTDLFIIEIFLKTNVSCEFYLSLHFNYTFSTTQATRLISSCTACLLQPCPFW